MIIAKILESFKKACRRIRKLPKTIDATDLSKENDLAVWSGSQMIDKTLYNIRRERRCEFIAEGMRKDDLLRWRSLDKMKNYQTEGFNWQEYQKEPYYVKQLAAGLVVSNSKYLRPHFANELIITNNGYNFEEANYLTLSLMTYSVFQPLRKEAIFPLPLFIRIQAGLSVPINMLCNRFR